MTPVRHVVFGVLKWLYLAAALVLSIRMVTFFWREHSIHALRFDRTAGMLQVSYNGLPKRDVEAASIERLTVRPLRTYNLRTLQIEEPHRTTEVLCVWYVFDRSFLSDRILSDLGQLLGDAMGVPFQPSAEFESAASSESDR